MSNFTVVAFLNGVLLGVKTVLNFYFKKLKGDISMSKRGDNIHKRKDGRWEGRYKKGRKPDGSIIYGSIYAKSYREVKTKLSEITKKMPEQNVTLPSEKTFGDVLELWMDNNRIRLKGGTINKYRNLIDSHIMQELGNVKLSNITSTVINNFLTQKLLKMKILQWNGQCCKYYPIIE